jgi:hypothetical protein
MGYKVFFEAVSRMRQGAIRYDFGGRLGILRRVSLPLPANSFTRMKNQKPLPLSSLPMSPLLGDRPNRSWTPTPNSFPYKPWGSLTLVFSTVPALPTLHTPTCHVKLYKMCVM